MTSLSDFERLFASEKIAATSIEVKTFPSDKTEVPKYMKVDIFPLSLEKLMNVLSKHFSNGFRMNSPIEMRRFRSFAAEDLGEEIKLTDKELIKQIAACGMLFDDNVYPISVETKKLIKETADSYFSDGAQVIFYAEFYVKNESWLSRASVVSENMLIVILLGLFPELSFMRTYFGYTDTPALVALEGEILRVWGDNVLRTYQQLVERLPYIPVTRIKQALGQNDDFIWNSKETFSHVSRIDIPDEEREAIRAVASRECNTHGYVSIKDLPFKEIEERNYELSITAVYNAVFRICLADDFEKKCRIITRKGNMLDALTIMKDYCQTIDSCSLRDLFNYEKELTGEVHRCIPIEAGNSVLVRIDKDTFVADRYVHFDSDMIDNVIERFLVKDYIPLKFFTTFAAFPDCGQTWNLFLLESYCRRFSRKFRFDAPSVNSRNAGAIIRKTCELDYTEIMTDAVANSNFYLNNTEVCKFLYESGYTGRRTKAKVVEIIDKAKAIREKRY